MAEQRRVQMLVPRRDPLAVRDPERNEFEFILEE